MLHLCLPILFSHQRESCHWLLTIWFCSCACTFLQEHVYFFNTTGTPAVLCVTPLCVLPCLLVQAFSLPTGFLQRLVSMCSATTPLRHDTLPFLSSSRPNPCRFEPIAQVTTWHGTLCSTSLNSFLQRTHVRTCILDLSHIITSSLFTQTCVLLTTLLFTYSVLDFGFCLLETKL